MQAKAYPQIAACAAVLGFVASATSAHAASYTRGVSVRVPMQCDVAVVSRRVDVRSGTLVAIFNEGCNAANGYEVVAVRPTAARWRSVEVDGRRAPLPVTEELAVSVSDTPGVRQRSMVIRFAGGSYEAGDLQLMIRPL